VFGTGRASARAGREMLQGFIGRMTVTRRLPGSKADDADESGTGDADDFDGGADDLFPKGRSTVGRKKAGRSRGQGTFWIFFFSSHRTPSSHCGNAIEQTKKMDHASRANPLVTLTQH